MRIARLRFQKPPKNQRNLNAQFYPGPNPTANLFPDHPPSGYSSPRHRTYFREFTDSRIQNDTLLSRFLVPLKGVEVVI